MFICKNCQPDHNYSLFIDSVDVYHVAHQKKKGLGQSIFYLKFENGGFSIEQMRN